MNGQPPILLVKRVTPEITEEDLLVAFQPFCNVFKVNILQSKSYAYVELEVSIAHPKEHRRSHSSNRVLR